MYYIYIYACIYSRSVRYIMIFVFPYLILFGHSPGAISTFRKQFPNHAYHITRLWYIIVLLFFGGFSLWQNNLSISAVRYEQQHTQLEDASSICAYNMWAKFSVLHSPSGLHGYCVSIRPAQENRRDIRLI